MVQYKILIVGGAGFIGYHFAKHFSKLGHKVFIIDNLSRGKMDIDLKKLLTDNKINFYKCDVKKKIEIKNNDFDYIIHLAAILGVSRVISSPYETLYQNINILNSVIEFALNCKKLKKFIFLSTSEVYAGTLRNDKLTFPTKENSRIIIDQDFPKRDSYYLSKIIGEGMVKYSLKKYVIFRPHNFFGERMGNSHVIPELFNKINKTKKKKIYLKNFNHFRCFCYIDDAIDLMSKVIFSKYINNKTLNIGDNSEEISILNLAKKITKFCNKNIKFIKLKEKDFSPKRRNPDISSVLNFNKRFIFKSFDKSLIKTLSWYSNKN